MNTVENIVESYFRLCRDCFTIPDMKVVDGNNRQIDLLAVDLKKDIQYHVEVSVTHCENWCPKPEELFEKFEKKFFGVPSKKEGSNTDHSIGKTYEHQINQTYKSVGIDPKRIKRVWVCWTVREDDNFGNQLKSYCKARKLSNNPIEVIKFKDEIIPSLWNAVSTSNYQDDVLRTLSLLKQYERQRKNKDKELIS